MRLSINPGYARMEARSVDELPVGPQWGHIALSPATRRIAQAREWLSGHAGTDGVVAKRPNLPYQTGERTGMQKIKRIRTAECVVSAFRYATKGNVAGSLLLGLYDADGVLHHVGFTPSLSAEERKRITPMIARRGRVKERPAKVGVRSATRPARPAARRRQAKS